MESKFHFSYCTVFRSDFIRVEVGDQVFLISKTGAAERTETILNTRFKESRSAIGEATNLYYRDTVAWNERTLDIQASIRLGSAPLGTRLSFNVICDGVVIGNYEFMRSYAGGGSHGSWPHMTLNNQLVLFEMPLDSNRAIDNRLLVECFREVAGALGQVECQPLERRKKKVTEDFFDEEFTYEQTKSSQRMIWSITTGENQFKMKGKLSLFHNQDFQRYHEHWYQMVGEYTMEAKSQYRDYKFIARNRPDGPGMFSLEYETEQGTHVVFPWGTESID